MSARAIFRVKTGPRLKLKDVNAKISVHHGEQGVITVKINSDADLSIEDVFEVEQDEELNEIRLFGVSSNLAKIPFVDIEVPGDTKFNIDQVFYIDVGTNQPIRVELHCQQTANILGGRGLEVVCEGQSSCNIEGASGDARVETRGQSEVCITGSLSEFKPISSGQSIISFIGHSETLVPEREGHSKIFINRVSVEEAQRARELKKEKILKNEINLERRRSGLITRSA